MSRGVGSLVVGLGAIKIGVVFAVVGRGRYNDRAVIWTEDVVAASCVHLSGEVDCTSSSSIEDYGSACVAVKGACKFILRPGL